MSGDSGASGTLFRFRWNVTPASSVVRRSRKESTMTKRNKKGKGRARRTFTAEQKAEILRRHIKGKEAVSDPCEEYGIQPSTFSSRSAPR